MRKSKNRIMILKAVLRSILLITIVLIVWKPVLDITSAVSQPQDPEYDMGDNYEIWWPGYLAYWKSKENNEYERLIHPERIKEFLLKDPWLIGRTKKGWFVLNKKKNEMHYPLSSEDKVRDITGIDFVLSDLITDPSPYLIVYPETKRAVARANALCWFLLFVLPITLGIGPYIWGVLRGMIISRK